MARFLLFFFFFLLNSFVCSSNQHEENSSGTNPNDEPAPCIDSLYRWNPVKVGHTRELQLNDEKSSKKYKMITRAIRPPIFEIPNFLTDEECNYIIKRVEDIGMAQSTIHMDPLQEKHLARLNASVGHANNSAGYWLSWDTDGDFEITTDEIQKFAVKYKKVHLSKEEVKEMIRALDLKEMDDGKIEYQEWKTLRTEAIDLYLNDLKRHHPHHRDRFSEQLWLYQGKESDSRLRIMRNRLQKLTRLSRKIIQGGEPLQVVKYGVRGHYHAHYDVTRKSDYPNSTCCHFNMLLSPYCRLCRYVTVLYFLNRVEEGGETAFPVADEEYFNETEFRNRKDGDRYNLSKFCKTSKVVVKPEKGKAIMWYNFELDQKTGWMGPRDERSLHGGCDILKGTKYVANNWIPANEPDSADQTSNYLLFDDEGFDDDDI